MNDYNESDDAQSRIDRIRGGGGGAQKPAQDDSFSEPEKLSVSRAGSRSQALRDEMKESRPEDQTTSRGRQGIMMIGGIVVVGILLVVIIALASTFTGDGEGSGINLPFLATDTPTPTPTSTPTETPVPTETPLPTDTPIPTKVAPSLSLPPLGCIFQSGVGCFDYCSNADNAVECQAAKDRISSQNADPDAWFACLSPGPGPNQGDPQECLEEAWRVANP